MAILNIQIMGTDDKTEQNRIADIITSAAMTYEQYENVYVEIIDSKRYRCRDKIEEVKPYVVINYEKDRDGNGSWMILFHHTIARNANCQIFSRDWKRCTG